MTQTIARTSSITSVAPVAIAPSLEQIIMHSPHAGAASHIYSLIATVAPKDSLKPYQALVLTPNPCLTGIN
ncbi:MAG: hypothetical protein MH252_18780 [Thermosynechococcaceae cyanobacterium MS004]|nr:hypothetical protein [Thermosynechococcaceae cyanobacterium MS004]